MNKVFVYGTLKPGFPNYPLLEQYSADCQEAEAVGVMFYSKYHKYYPYVLFGGTGGDRVKGFVFTFKDEDVDKVVTRLDRLEGNPRHYQRVAIEIELANGKHTMAWAYDGIPSLEEIGEVVEGGEWINGETANR
jgi:gamma-glutamylcyclotransferase (GGCT)/AIG2-like uncharacterized protein YtfP